MAPSPRVPRSALEPDVWDGVTVDLIFANLFPCPPQWKIDPEVVAHTGLFYVWQGEGWVEQNGARLDALPGDLFFTRPGGEVAAGHRPDRPVSVLSTGMQLQSRAGSDPLRRIALPARLRLPEAVRGDFTAAFSELIGAFHDRTPTGQLAARGCALRLLARALELAASLPASARTGALAGKPGDGARVTQALEYIDRHLHEPLQLATLAKVTHLSPIYFSSLFRKETGRPPMAYVLDRRIEKARALLAGSDRTVEKVAQMVGFTDPFHFSRAFRRKTGMPPTAYRAGLKSPFLPKAP